MPSGPGERLLMPVIRSGCFGGTSGCRSRKDESSGRVAGYESDESIFGGKIWFRACDFADFLLLLQMALWNGTRDNGNDALIGLIGLIAVFDQEVWL